MKLADDKIRSLVADAIASSVCQSEGSSRIADRAWTGANTRRVNLPADADSTQNIFRPSNFTRSSQLTPTSDELSAEKERAKYSRPQS